MLYCDAEDSNILLGMTRRSLRPLHFCLVVIVTVVAFSIWLYNNNSLPEHTLYLVICAEIRTRRFRHSKTYTRRRNVSLNKITHPSPMALHSMTSYIIQEKDQIFFFREKVSKKYIFPLTFLPQVFFLDDPWTLVSSPPSLFLVEHQVTFYFSCIQSRGSFTHSRVFLFSLLEMKRGRGSTAISLTPGILEPSPLVVFQNTRRSIW